MFRMAALPLSASQKQALIVGLLLITGFPNEQEIFFQLTFAYTRSEVTR